MYTHFFILWAVLGKETLILRNEYNTYIFLFMGGFWKWRILSTKFENHKNYQRFTDLFFDIKPQKESKNTYKTFNSLRKT